MLRRALIPLLVLVALCPALGQQPAQQDVSNVPTKTVVVHRIDAKIKLDGKLDEPVWQQVQPFGDLVQTDPDLGAPVSEKTEVRIFFDANNIYFGIKCYDAGAKGIIHRLGPHDGRTGSDSIDIMLDTFHDRRTAFYFSINDLGVQFDGLEDESRGGSGFSIIDPSWDGIWYSAGVVEDWGWSIEVIIPFKSIRVSHAGTQVWGFNINRTIPRKNESASWQPVSRYDGIMKPSKAGLLVGLEDVHVGRNLELIPYGSTSNRWSQWAPQLDGFSGAGGLDARYGLAANLTASLTLNPDFAETEADEFTSEISRFEIFFPEKRKFFTEGANYFQTPMNLFFSRRVGARLPDGEPQRIYEGLKLTGQARGWTIGALEALTQRTEFTDPNTGAVETEPGALFGVLRLQHGILQKSSIGFLSVNRLQQDPIARDINGNVLSESESTQAVDLSILSGQHTTWASQFMINFNALHAGFDAQHLGWQSTYTYDSEKYLLFAQGKFLGNKVDVSSTGFEPEVDRWGGDLVAEYKPFINRYGIRQIFLEAEHGQSNGTQGEIESSGTNGIFEAQFKNFWDFRAVYSYDRTRFFLFTPDFRQVCTVNLACTRLYLDPNWYLQLSTNRTRRWYVQFRYAHGKETQFNENFHGFFHEYLANVTALVGSHLNWDATAIYISEYLDSGRPFQDRRFLISRLTYQFTPKWRARVLAQYESDIHGKNLSVNSLVAYDFTARSAFFVGYNHQRHTPLQPSDLGNEVFVKVSYLFSF